MLKNNDLDILAAYGTKLHSQTWEQPVYNQCKQIRNISIKVVLAFRWDSTRCRKPVLQNSNNEQDVFNIGVNSNNDHLV